jgi:hypothetical protein
VGAGAVSDFLFTTRPRAEGELRAALHRYLGHVSAEVAELHGAWGSLAIARAPHDPEPLLQDARAVSVLIGEPMARLASAAGPAVEPAHRARVHAALAAPAETAWEDALDGPFAALFIDLEHGGGMVVTDLFAWIPVFSAFAGDGLVLGTHPDAVARIAGAAVDPVSAAELVAHLTITWPRTLYDGVTQVAPGTERGFDADGWMDSGRQYWRPEERDDVYPTIDAAAEALRTALVDDVQLALSGQEHAGLLLSGGEDSRAVLGAVPPGVRVTGFTYADADNREVRSARRVARAYGAAFVFGRRAGDHYLRGLEPVARMVGSQNEYIDAHGYGFHTELGLADLPIVLGGLSSDALLKADNVPARRVAAVLRGEVSAIRPAPLPSMVGIRPALLAEAAERRNAYRAELARLRPRSADEWSRIYPFTMRKYAANHHGNRRLFRVHEPFMSNPVVRLAASVPQRWKVNRRLFHLAIAPLLQPSWWVPHSRNRFPSLGVRGNAIARPLLGLARDARALATGEWRANQESWPLWDKLVQSPAMSQAEARVPLAASALAEIVETADDARIREQMRTWPPRQRLTALQVAYLTGFDR